MIVADLADDRALDVAVVGVANIDLVTRVPALPRDGETAFGTELETRPGGKGLNQAVAVARNGGRAGLAAKAGDDPWGRMLKQALASNRVDISAFTPRTRWQNGGCPRPGPGKR